MAPVNRQGLQAPCPLRARPAPVPAITRPWSRGRSRWPAPSCPPCRVQSHGSRAPAERAMPYMHAGQKGNGTPRGRLAGGGPELMREGHVRRNLHATAMILRTPAPAAQREGHGVDARYLAGTGAQVLAAACQGPIRYAAGPSGLTAATGQNGSACRRRCQNRAGVVLRTRNRVARRSARDRPPSQG